MKHDLGRFGRTNPPHKHHGVAAGFEFRGSYSIPHRKRLSVYMSVNSAAHGRHWRTGPREDMALEFYN